MKRSGRLVDAAWSTSRNTTSYPAWAATCAMPWPISPAPSTPTFDISISLRSDNRSSAGRVHGTRRDRGPRAGPSRGDDARGEAKRAERRADPRAGRGVRGGGRRRVGARRGVTRRRTDVLVRDGSRRAAAAVREPGRAALLPRSDPALLEPARGDAQGDDRADPRRRHRRRDGTGARL